MVYLAAHYSTTLEPLLQAVLGASGRLFALDFTPLTKSILNLINAITELFILLIKRDVVIFVVVGNFLVSVRRLRCGVVNPMDFVDKPYVIHFDYPIHRGSR